MSKRALIAEGHSSSEIASRLFMSSRTVKTHRSNMMRKLGLHSQAEVVSFAFRRGIVPLAN